MRASTDGGGMQSTYLPVGITVKWQKKWNGGVRLSHYGAQGPREPTGVSLLSFDLENILSLWVLQPVDPVKDLLMDVYG